MKRTALYIYLFIVELIVLSPSQAIAGSESSNSLESPVTLVAYMAAGIGIFLVGIKLVGSHLKHMSGGSFKDIVSRVGTNKLGILLGGNLLGFFTQSGKANSFILAGFVQVGLLNVPQSLPMVYWGNAGASLIVVASVLPIKVIVMFLLGITGLGLTFGMPKRMIHSYGVLFGIGMIMYGLFQLKTGAGGFIDYPWLPPLLEKMKGVYLLSFLIGVLLTLVAQSDMAVSMIAIAMASSGIFGLPESAMLVYGTQGGASLLTYGFSFNFKGRARQVVIGQVFFKAIVTILFIIAFYIESFVGVPLVMSFSRAVSSVIGVQVAIVVLVMSFLGAFFVLFINKPLTSIVEKLYPPSESEVLSEPRYLSKYASNDPQTGLMLIEQEQLELLNRLPYYLDSVRKPNQKKSADVYHEAFESISKVSSETLSLISGQVLSGPIADSLITTTKMQEELVNLEDIVFKICNKLKQTDGSATSTTSRLGSSILESLDFILLTAIDATKSRDVYELQQLEIITGDRSDVMDKVRRNYFNSEGKLSDVDRNFILDITILFENAVLTIARYRSFLSA